MVDIMELMLFAGLEKLAQVNRATFLFQSRSPPVRALKHHRTDQSERLVERYSYYTYLGTYLDVKRHWDFIIMLSL